MPEQSARQNRAQATFIIVPKMLKQSACQNRAEDASVSVPKLNTHTLKQEGNSQRCGVDARGRVKRARRRYTRLHTLTRG